MIAFCFVCGLMPNGVLLEIIIGITEEYHSIADKTSLQGKTLMVALFGDNSKDLFWNNVLYRYMCF